MKTSLTEFVESLVGSSLMNASEVEAFFSELPSASRPKGGASLARLLVERNRLTLYQAEAIQQGATTGLVLGNYEVLHPIGRGGMGQVFKARHRVMERVVAVKTLPTTVTKLKEAVDRFHVEIIAAARLSHPNIVIAFDAGESHGIHYLVMEYVDGGNLASYVKKHGRLPVSAALGCVMQAARGLEFAHAENIIHRDVKPSNLLLDKHGIIKVLDLGLARLKEKITPPDTCGSKTCTATIPVMGSIDYMPPEQVQNFKKANERSDVYSLGCTLYYLLIGRTIYHGRTTAETLRAHREAAIPSLRIDRPEISEDLDGVFHKMIAKKPEDRHASMTEVISDLDKCGTPKLTSLAQATDLGDEPFSCDLAETRIVVASEDTPADDFRSPDFSLGPVVFPQRKQSEKLLKH